MADAENTDLHQKLLGYFQSTLDNPSAVSFYNNAINDFEFREGAMWTAAEIAELTARGQAPIVENEIKPIVDKLIGQYVTQQTRIGFVGRNVPQDEALGEALTDLALYVQQQTDYEHEEKDSFSDGVTCGFGVIEAGIDDSGLKPKIILQHVDCLSVFPDPYSRKYDWSDAEYVSRAKWVNVDTVKAKYPEMASAIDGSANLEILTNSIPSFKKEQYWDGKNGRLRLIETWYKSYEKRKYAQTVEGIQDVTKLPKSRLKGLNVAEKNVTKIKMAVWCIGGVLEATDSPYNHDMFPFIPYYVDRKKNGEPVGIVRQLKDPNSEINKRRSKALHLMTTNQALFEQNGVVDKDVLRSEMARPDGLIEYKKGYKFELNNNIDLAQTQMSLLSESKQAIKRISGQDQGFSQEVRSNAQLQRKQQSEDIVFVPVFDNLRRTRKIVAKHIYELIKQYYDEEMVFNVTDDMQKAKTVTIPQDLMAKIKESECDIIVEEMPETTTIQAEQFTMITQMMQSMNLPPNLSMALLPIMIRMSQLRNKDEILKQFEAMNEPPADLPKISLAMDWSNMSPEERIAMAAGPMQLPELAQAIAANPVPSTNVIKAQEGLQKIQMKVQGDIEKAYVGKPDPEAEMEQKEMEMEMKAYEHQMKMGMEQEKHMMKMQQSSEKGQHDMQMKRMQGEQQMVQSHMQGQQKLSHSEQAAEIARKQASQKPQPKGNK